MPIAHGSLARTAREDAALAPTVIRSASHSTAAAITGTEMLSSTRTGKPSTSAAVIAAAIGAQIAQSYGIAPSAAEEDVLAVAQTLLGDGLLTVVVP